MFIARCTFHPNLSFAEYAQLTSLEWIWTACLAFIFSLQWILYSSSIDGNWLASGTDLTSILPRLRAAGGHEAWGWVIGPWVGRDLFPYYRPTTSLFTWAEYGVFGGSPAGFQAASLLLHGLSVVLVAILVRAMFQRAIPAVLAAFGWGLRARNDLAIAWTPAQTDIIACLLTISALILLGKLRAYSTRSLLGAGHRLFRSCCIESVDCEESDRNLTRHNLAFRTVLLL